MVMSKRLYSQPGEFAKANITPYYGCTPLFNGGFMNRKYLVANSLMWAAAIVASAELGAPTMLTVILLPSLAAMSWLAALPVFVRDKNCD